MYVSIIITWGLGLTSDKTLQGTYDLSSLSHRAIIDCFSHKYRMYCFIC